MNYLDYLRIMYKNLNLLLELKQFIGVLPDSNVLTAVVLEQFDLIIY